MKKRIVFTDAHEAVKFWLLGKVSLDQIQDALFFYNTMDKYEVRFASMKTRNYEEFKHYKQSYKPTRRYHHWQQQQAIAASGKVGEWWVSDVEKPSIQKILAYEKQAFDEGRIWKESDDLIGFLQKHAGKDAKAEEVFEFTPRARDIVGNARRHMGQRLIALAVLSTLALVEEVGSEVEEIA